MHRIYSKLFNVPLINSVLFWIAFILLLVGAGILSSSFPGQGSRLAYGIGGTGAALLTTYLFIHLHRSSFTSIGLHWDNKSALRFFLGLLLGGIVMAIIIAILYSITNLQWERNYSSFSIEMITGYAAILPLALMEEIAFRAYPFVTLHKRYGLWITQLIVAIAFALYHLPGGQSLTGVLAGAGIWALVFGLAAAWSGGIAMPFGIHVALNAGQLIMGLKGNESAIWKISTPTNAFEVDNIGLAIQFAVLAVGVSLTQFYINRQKRNNVKLGLDLVAHP